MFKSYQNNFTIITIDHELVTHNMTMKLLCLFTDYVLSYYYMTKYEEKAGIKNW